MMPNSDLKVLGEKVRTERKLAGLTQEQLAERCHVSTKHIANIEKGSMNPSYEILLAIARVLPVSLDALITPGMGKTEIELACHLLTPRSYRPQCGQSDLQGGQCRCCG